MARTRLRFGELWSRLGAEGSSDPTYDEMAAAYGGPDRAYHTLDHVADCLAQLDAAGAGDGRHDAVEAAVWFHDVVYDTRRRDSEERSAAWAGAAMRSAKVAPGAIEHVARLIRLTDHKMAPDDGDAELLCDVDLSILGRGSAEFEEYQRRIRAEYAWVSEPLYRAGRSRVLAGFLSRPRIFRTSWFYDRYETATRDNLRRAIAAFDS